MYKNESWSVITCNCFRHFSFSKRRRNVKNAMVVRETISRCLNLVAIVIHINFQVKLNIVNVLDDVDIPPGRSRIVRVQCSLQPSVFGFDKYYTLKNRMLYTGGATLLSKALAFSARLLYREQNLRDVKMRNHKLMPTPRRDRLQVSGTLCMQWGTNALLSFPGSSASTTTPRRSFVSPVSQLVLSIFCHQQSPVSGIDLGGPNRQR
ncbi:unnamed protein product [Angiostrongylus costaricensis]|uniref:Uncharacterized protein n=1 Tax=Angiostrongylus costaricensis TaxID=334426 RepID=A0A0R3PRH1_ANGCS|nr:unnamed protein product [Angiostrongylus costaricensis]